MIKPLFATVLFACSCIPVSAQKIAELTVPAEGLTPGMEQPLAIDLDNISLLPDTTIALVEVKKGKREPVPFQIEHKGKRTLHWIIQQDNTSKRVFELINTTPPQAATPMHISKDTGVLVIVAGSKKLLQYNYKTKYPPPGVDTVFKRSGFIHPLWTPHGQALTRLSPSDHYHHFGLWNPWTKLHFQGQTYDCWNLRDKQGTVRYAGFVSVNEGPVFGDYQVLHQHVVFTKNDGEKTAINELQSVRIYQPADASDYYIMDISTLTFSLAEIKTGYLPRARIMF